LPKALVTVDLYGQCADYDALTALADQYGVPIIEDAAEALGASYRGRPAGSFGRMGVFSFNGNKIITTGGGGMLVADDRQLADQARHLATQARDDAPHYEHSLVGYNYRLSNLLASVGSGQLRSLPRKLEARAQVNLRYRAAFADQPGIGFLPDAPDGEQPLAHRHHPRSRPRHRHTAQASRARALDIEARPREAHAPPAGVQPTVVGGGSPSASSPRPVPAQRFEPHRRGPAGVIDAVLGLPIGDDRRSADPAPLRVLWLIKGLGPAAPRTCW
jgi:dTDP-4-amino-4,6-dideoxygalactose transaminase